MSSLLLLSYFCAFCQLGISYLLIQYLLYETCLCEWRSDYFVNSETIHDQFMRMGIGNLLNYVIRAI